MGNVLSMASMNPRKEKALIRASIEGDSEAFEVLYLHYMERIYRYIYFRVGDEAQAEDMTEDVFVRAWESLPKYRLGKSRFTSWLYTIAHNLLVDYYRRRNPVHISTEDLARYSDPGDLPERIVSRKQEFDVLIKLIQQLDILEQEVLLLRFVEGLSHREIGAIIGKSQSASRVIQHRALKALRKIMVQKGIRHG
jgi:RNA polymerase sigma-70 factor (ECF subfamily)